MIPSQRSGSNSQLRALMLNEGQGGEVGLRVRCDDEIGQCVRRDVTHDDAVAGVAARTREARLASPPDTEGDWSRGIASGPPQRWVIEPSRVGKSSRSVASSEAKTFGFSSIARLDRRTEVVRRAATAEGDAVVARALSVDDEVSVVGEGLVLGEADLVPEARRLAARSRS